MRKKVNIALIGSGFMGKEHSKAYALAPVIFPDIPADPVRKVVCDISEDIAKNAAEMYGFEEYCVDIDEILKRDDIDIVDVCTPPDTHAEILCKAMEAGKYVFCEKPLVTTFEDAEKILTTMQKTNGRTAVGLNKQRWPAVRYAKQLVEEGFIGKPQYYNGQYLQNGGQHEEFFWGFRNLRLKGGGFDDSTSHILDMGRYILGDFDDVIGMTDHYRTEAIARPLKPGEKVEDVPKTKRDVEDIVAIMAHMKNGALARFLWTDSYSGAGEGISFEVTGTEGAIIWSGQRPSELIVSSENDKADMRGYKTILMGPAHPYGQAVPPLPGFGVGVADNMAFQAYEVVKSCVNNTKYLPDFVDGVKYFEICAAVRESITKKTWVKISN